MKRKQSASFLPKKLISLSLDSDQSISLERVKAILESLRHKPAHKLKPLLKKYRFYLLRENRKNEALVEYSGSIAASEIEVIQQSLQNHYGHKITLIQRENNELLAGFRVSIGDDIWETSIANNLKHLLTQH